MKYRVSKIEDDCGSWGRGPNGEYETVEAAEAAAIEYMEDHVGDGDYDQSPVNRVTVSMWAWIETIAEDEEDAGVVARVEHDVSIGGEALDAGLSPRAIELLERVYDPENKSELVIAYDAEDRAAYAEIEAAGLMPRSRLWHVRDVETWLTR